MLSRRRLLHLSALQLPAVGLGLAASGTSALAQDDPEEKPIILVFTSVSDERSTQIVQAFKDGVGGFAIRMSYDLSQYEDAAYFISDNLRDLDAAMVFAVGEKALKAAAREFIRVPVIFTDAKADATIGRSDVIGVAKRVDPRAAIERLRVLMPKLDAVGAISSTRDSDPYWSALEQACKDLGIAYTQRKVANPSEVPNVQAELMSSVDVLYIQDDDGLWTGSTLSKAFNDASIAGFPVVSFSTRHFDSPQRPAVVMVTNPNGVGQTAAQIAREMLVEKRPTDQLSPGYPAPVVWGDKEMLIKGRVLITKKTSEAIDFWHGG